jgi:hypothetical protein
MIYLDKQINRETLAPNMDPVEKAERYLQSVQIPTVISLLKTVKKHFLLFFFFSHRYLMK